jgi:lipoprotein NlpI
MRPSIMVIAAILLNAAASSALLAGHCDSELCRGGDLYGRSTGRTGTDPGSVTPDRIALARLDPKGSDARHSHDIRDQARSDLSQIIVYYDAAIKREPKDDDAYFHRGIANFYAGDRVRALADLRQASRFDPEYPYYALWIHIVEQRGDAPSSLAQTISQISMAKWPAPVIRLFLGNATPAAVLAAAADPDVNIRRGQICEAHFYSAELALQQGDRKEAARLFRLAAAGCPREFVEGAAAGAELDALDQNP